ncbi:MAG TPA: hypothetical protein EYG03_09235 [Planctomycetes bacterium]|nr:hypothetical protein [Planctomycetaceae bacterium]HIK92147.1 hypothetical protein [Planctomycetota bacterium]
MNTGTACLLGASIVVASVISTLGKGAPSGDQNGADAQHVPSEFEAIQVDFEGITGTRETVTSDSGFHVTLTDRFAIIKGDGHGGPYTYWIPRQRLIQILDVERTRSQAGMQPPEDIQIPPPGRNGASS